mmetsp:Transcript_25756/g.72429  ORF Transcript_25756/g.72429 Transcript_25756/m.72429 type:complete len:262 (-) Transcript_25756:513-1298(-)
MRGGSGDTARGVRPVRRVSAVALACDAHESCGGSTSHAASFGASGADPAPRWLLHGAPCAHSPRVPSRAAPTVICSPAHARWPAAARQHASMLSATPSPTASGLETSSAPCCSCTALPTLPSTALTHTACISAVRSTSDTSRTSFRARDTITSSKQTRSATSRHSVASSQIRAASRSSSGTDRSHRCHPSSARTNRRTPCAARSHPPLRGRLERLLHTLGRATPATSRARALDPPGDRPHIHSARHPSLRLKPHDSRLPWS